MLPAIRLYGQPQSTDTAETEEKDAFMKEFDKTYQPESIVKGDTAAGEADYKAVLNTPEDAVTSRAKLYDWC